MMLPPVYTVLRAVPGIVAMVGERIYRHGSVPQDSATSPYVSWALAGNQPVNELSDVPGRDRLTVQVDCWHLSDTGVEALATMVRDAIEPLAHMTGIIVDSREPDTKLYRISLQFDWWLSRA